MSQSDNKERAQHHGPALQGPQQLQPQIGLHLMLFGEWFDVM